MIISQETADKSLALIKMQKERIAELESELAPLEGRKVIDTLKYVDSLERKVVNLTDENKALREIAKEVVDDWLDTPAGSDVCPLNMLALQAALQEQGDE